MQIYKYRIVKQMKYKDSMDMYALMETAASKMLKFIEENNTPDGAVIYLDLRLLLEEKNAE